MGASIHSKPTSPAPRLLRFWKPPLPQLLNHSLLTHHTLLKNLPPPLGEGRGGGRVGARLVQLVADFRSSPTSRSRAKRWSQAPATSSARAAPTTGSFLE